MSGIIIWDDRAGVAQMSAQFNVTGTAGGLTLVQKSKFRVTITSSGDDVQVCMRYGTPNLKAQNVNSIPPLQGAYTPFDVPFNTNPILTAADLKTMIDADATWGPRTTIVDNGNGSLDITVEGTMAIIQFGNMAGASWNQLLKPFNIDYLESSRVAVRLSVTGNAVRYKIDGSTPTAADGDRIPVNEHDDIFGIQNVKRLLLIEEAADANVHFTVFI